MEYRNCSRLFAVFATLALTIALSAGLAHAKDPSTTFKSSLSLPSPATLGGKQLPAGSYSVIADESKITLKQGGKVVAEAPIEWKDAGQKEFANNVVVEANSIKEIRFGGKTRYIVVQQTGTSTGQ